MLNKKNSTLLIVALVGFGLLGDLSAGTRRTPAKTPAKTPGTPSQTDEAKRLAEKKALEEKEKAEAAAKRRERDKELAREAAMGNVETYDKLLTKLYLEAHPDVQAMEEKMLAKQKALKDEAEAYAKNPKLPKPLENPIPDKEFTDALVKGVSTIFVGSRYNTNKDEGRLGGLVGDGFAALGKTDGTGYAEKKAKYDDFAKDMKTLRLQEEQIMRASGGRGRGGRGRS